MLWLLMALLVVVGGFSILRRRATFETAESEPWRQSLDEDEPLDFEEIERAEREWLESEDWEESEEGEEGEDWR